ncbi:MAG: molecular chaperone HtpG [Planctomycetes bacterium]|nr:molecular chaperone HtpG [Planctomycetota bacterium]MCB9883998.1 molecular chaperone HtpG [Planctomycetota bacterium]
MTGTVEKHVFQAEVNEVLSLVVNSLYSHREVFLRELISNAADAIDQLNFRALTDHGLLAEDKELRIELIRDEQAGTLTIRDNGIGMTRDELIEHLGTIARSGSKKLMQSLSAEQKKDLSLIGQFGVGFYSAFLVADTVTVTTRKAGSDETWIWESQAKGDFEIRAGERATRGTDIVLHLKEDAKEYVQEWPVRDVVRKYSDFVRWPIRMQTEHGEGDDKKLEWQTLNSARALWSRPKSEVTDEQYEEFYKSTSHDWQAPLGWTHFKVEGTHELTGLLYVPSKAPFDLVDKRHSGVRLFVKRVFIMDDAQEIVPEWLRFVRGIVDSEDLPLNVSREILQKDATTRFIKKQVVGKTLSLLEELAAEGETEREVDGEKQKVRRYETFWTEFGRMLKEGVYHDFESRDRLAGLLRFRSSHDDGWHSFADYVGRMQAEQKAIYYVAADSLATAKSSPHIEALEKRGFEVLLMTDSIDEWVVDALREFDGKQLVSAAKGALDLPETEEEKQHKEELQKELKPVLERAQKVLDEDVKEVRVTDRLTDSPSCLVNDGLGMSARQERVLREAGHDVPKQKRVLELNPEHPVVKRLAALTDEGQFAEWTQLLHDQALLAEGALPSDPAAFARRVAKLMSKA